MDERLSWLSEVLKTIVTYHTSQAKQVNLSFVSVAVKQTSTAGMHVSIIALLSIEN